MSRTRAAPLVLFLLAPALAGWNPFVRRDPEVRRGNEAYRAGAYDRALESYGAAEERAGPVPEAALGKGAALYKMGESAAAKSASPEEAEASKGVFEQAGQSFQNALGAPDPKLKARAYYNLGNAKARAGEPREAIESYVKALMLDPALDDAKANLELARLFLQQQQNKKQPQESDKGKKQEEESQEGQDKQSQAEEKDPERHRPKPDPEKDSGEKDEKPPENAQTPTPDQNEESAQSPNPLADARQGEMSPEEAERLLDSLKRKEVNLQHWNRMMEEYKDRKTVVEKDW